MAKSLKKLAPANKQRPGGDPGPGGAKINSAHLLSASGTKLMTGSSAYRGKGK
jgi:hypothetical protein